MVSSLKPKVANVIETQFSEHIRTVGDGFVEFAKEYYKWLEETGSSPVSVVRDLSEQHDHDLADEFYKILIERRILDNLPTSLQVDKSILLKNIKSFFRSKGTEASFRFLLNALYGETVEFDYGRDLCIRSSDSKLEHKTVICVRKPIVEAVANITRGQVSGITLTNSDYGFFEAPTASLVRNDDTELTPIEIDFDLTGHVTGVAVKNGGYGYSYCNITVVGPCTTPAIVTANVTDGIVTSVTVVNAGSGYKERPTVTVDGDGDGVLFEVNWVATIDQSSFDIISGGSGFKVPPVIDFIGGTGTSAPDYVENFTDADLEAVRLGNTATTIIRPAEASVTIDQNGTIDSISLIYAGGGYVEKPTLKVQTYPKTDASLRVVMSGSKVGYVVVETPGDGYEVEPTVVFSYNQPDYTNISGNVVEQLGERFASAIVDTYIEYSIGGVSYYLIKLQHAGINGDFIPNSVVKFNTQTGSVYGIVEPILNSIVLQELGSMYSVGDRISFDPSAATTNNSAEAEVVLNDGAVVAVNITNQGFGYSDTPSIVISGNGVGAEASCVVSAGRVVSIDIISGGSGYTSATVNIVGGLTVGQNSSAVAVVNEVHSGSVDSVFISKHGSGYSVGDTIVSSNNDATGSGFSAEVVSVDGVGASVAPMFELDQFVFENTGSGYAVGDSFIITNGSRTTADLDSNEQPIHLRVSSVASSDEFVGVNVTSSGSGYTAVSYAIIDASSNACIRQIRPTGKYFKDVAGELTYSSTLSTYEIVKNQYGGIETIVAPFSDVDLNTSNVKSIVNGYGCSIQISKINASGGISAIYVQDSGINYVSPAMVITGGTGNNASISVEIDDNGRVIKNRKAVITAATHVAGTVTVTCDIDIDDSLSVDDYVLISGSDNQNINGQHKVMSVTNNQFTFAVSGSSTAATTGTLHGWTIVDSGADYTPSNIPFFNSGQSYIENDCVVATASDSSFRVYLATGNIASGGSAPTHTAGIVSSWKMLCLLSKTTSQNVSIIDSAGSGAQTRAVLKQGAVTGLVAESRGRLKDINGDASAKYTAVYNKKSLSVQHCTVTNTATETLISTTDTFENVNIGQEVFVVTSDSESLLGIVGEKVSNTSLKLKNKITSLPEPNITLTFKSSGSGLMLELYYKLLAVDVVDSGEFYSSYTLSLEGGHGSGAAVQLDIADRAIGTLFVANGGTGYTQAELYAESNTGTGFHATATINLGQVSGSIIKNRGTNYRNPEIRIIGTGTGAILAPVMNTDGTITAVHIADGGVGYDGTTSVVVGREWQANTIIAYNEVRFYGSNLYRAKSSGTTGNQQPNWTDFNAYSDQGTSLGEGVVWDHVGTVADISVSVTSGAITGVTLNSGGLGYDYTIIKVNGDGTSAILAVSEIYDGVITDVEVINGGSGYHVDCMLSFDNVPSVDSNIKLNFDSGVLVSADVISGGSGYSHNTKASVVYSEITKDSDPVQVLTGLSSNITEDTVYQYNGVSLSATTDNIFPSKSIGLVNYAFSFVDFVDVWTENINTPKDARLSVETASYGEIVSIDVTSHGAGYYSNDERTPISLVVNGAGTGASASAVVSGGSIVGVSALVGGQNYTTAPDVIIHGIGDGASAHATLTSYVKSVYVTQAGVGYNNVPAVSFIGTHPTGSPKIAQGYATVQLTSGSVESVSIIEQGSLYEAPVTFVAGDMWASGASIVVGDQRVEGGNLYTATTSGITGAVPPVGLTTHNDGGVAWAYSGPASSGNISVVDGKLYSATVTVIGYGYNKHPTINIFSSVGAGGAVVANIPCVISDVIITNGGYDYTEPPTIVFSSNTGVGATAVCEMDSKIGAVVIDSSGTGYDNTTTIEFNNSGTGGSGAILHPVVKDGSIVDVYIIDGGTGYTNGATNISVVGGKISGTDAVLTPVLNEIGAIVDVTIVNGGTGYFYGTRVVIVGDGEGATAVANVNTGITDVIIESSASYYDTTPIISVVDDTSENVVPGSGAILIPSVVDGKIVEVNIVSSGVGYSNPKVSVYHPNDNRVNNIVVTNSGSGYVSAPLVTISPAVGDVGSGASATAIVENGMVVGIVVTNAGYGYNKTPLVTIAPPVGGVQATAIVETTITSIRAISDRRIDTVSITSGGKNYTSASVVIYGDGDGAKALANISKDSLKKVKVDYSGNRYTSTPTIKITDDSGYGAISSVKIKDGGYGYTTLPVLKVVSDIVDPGTGAEIIAYSNTIGRVKSIRFDEFDFGDDDLPLVRFPIKAILNEAANFIANELVYVDGYDYDGDYTSGPHGYIQSIDYDRNLVTIGNATAQFIIVSEDGSIVVPENATAADNNASVIAHEFSNAIGVGAVLIGERSQTRGSIVAMNRATGTSRSSGIAQYPLKIVESSSVANDNRLRLHDNQKYQDFSYITKTGIAFSEYKEYTKALVHPAGYMPFGDISIKTNLSMPISLPIDEETGQAFYEVIVLYLLMLPGLLDRKQHEQWRLNGTYIDELYSSTPAELTDMLSFGYETNCTWPSEIFKISESFIGTYTSSNNDSSVIISNQSGVQQYDNVYVEFTGSGSGFSGTVDVGEPYTYFDGRVSNISIVSGGVGYAEQYTSIEIQDETGSGAEIVATISGGVVTDISIKVDNMNATNTSFAEQVATIEVEVDHKLATGDKVTISGATGANAASYNKEFVVRVIGNRVFEIDVYDTASTASGTLSVSAIRNGRGYSNPSLKITTIGHKSGVFTVKSTPDSTLSLELSDRKTISTIKSVKLQDGSSNITDVPTQPVDGLTTVDVPIVSTNSILYEGHGFVDGERVVYRASSDKIGAVITPISGLSSGAQYFIVDATADTFKLSSTSGGSAISINDASVNYITVHTFADVGVSASGQAKIVKIGDGSVGYNKIRSWKDGQYYDMNDYIFVDGVYKFAKTNHTSSLATYPEANDELWVDYQKLTTTTYLS